MGYSDLIFDLYGTLVDIHTEETCEVWEKTALLCRYFGAHWTGPELKGAFDAAMARQKAAAGQSYECFPDLPFEPVLAKLLREKGLHQGAEDVAAQAARLFRICSTEYLRLYPQVLESLAQLRQNGRRLWLLSNAQAIFTRGEFRALGLEDAFDGVYLSSDYGCRKPDRRFFEALLHGQKLDPAQCLMIGNDRETDIAGAQAVGLATLYLHTNLTPGHQSPADPRLHPRYGGKTMEFEGAHWPELVKFL